MTDSGAERAARRIADFTQHFGIFNEEWHRNVAAIILEETGTQWIWVGERMPEYGTVSMVYARERGKPDVRWIDLATYSYHGGWSVGTDRDKWGEHEVTHWAVLPPAPEEGGKR